MENHPSPGRQPFAMSADDARDILTEVGDQFVDLDEVDLDDEFEDIEEPRGTV